MKYDKKEPETMDADPMRLLVSAILAFTVMLFINGFVGSMGGFPAFVAFTLIFFRIRTRAGMENGGMLCRNTVKLAFPLLHKLIYIILIFILFFCNGIILQIQSGCLIGIQRFTVRCAFHPFL